MRRGPVPDARPTPNLGFEIDRTCRFRAPDRATRVWTVVLVVIVVALVVTACGGSEGGAMSGRAPSEPQALAGVQPEGMFAVGTTRRALMDRTRPTPAHGGAPQQPQRDLPTLLLYPAVGTPGGGPVEGAEPIGGPWPLIVFSHGSTRSGVDYVKTLSVWASAGYIVAAPDYPLSHTGVPGGTDYGESPSQAHDVAFVIDQLSAAAKGGDDRVLDGRLISGAVGIAGQSFGAMTSLLAGFHTCCAISSVDAVVSFAGAAVPDAASGTLTAEAAARPLLSIHGDDDPTLGYAGEHDAWLQLHGDKYFLTLPGGGHDDGFFGGLSTPQDRVVALASLGFFDRYLKDDRNGTVRMDEAVTSAGPSVATLERQ